MSTIKHAGNVLRHLHLPGITPFSSAQTLQTSLVSTLLTHKATISSPSPPSPLPPEPSPTILTFIPTPVYTTGRREQNILSPSQLATLKRPLRSPDNTYDEYAEVIETLRGGQITFHGPGQLVIYPILSISSIRTPLFPRGISPRCYIHLLEETTIQTLQSHCSIPTIRTENPGVWMENGKEKIAAIGVHLRRGVTSYGVAINISTDLRWFERVVACGLVGKEMTSLKAQGRGEGAKYNVPRHILRHFGIADAWCRVFRRNVWGDVGGLERERTGEMDERLRGLGLLGEEGMESEKAVNWKDGREWRVEVGEGERGEEMDDGRVDWPITLSKD